MIKYPCCSEEHKGNRSSVIFVLLRKRYYEGVVIPLRGVTHLFCFREGKNMKKNNHLIRLVLSSMFLALAYVLPFLTGQIPEIGNMLCPMHIPVLLCGFICSAPWGAAVGFSAPLLRSAILGRPVMFPDAISMSFELMVYGLLSGLLYRIFPKKKVYIYVSLIISMLAGRVVWGVVKFMLLGFDMSAFGMSAFIAGAFTNAIPGIILQLAAVPVLVMVTEKITKKHV